MAKAALHDSSGNKKSATISLPSLFETKIREDIVQKYFEALKSFQPYSAKYRSGLRQVASGTISHKRHDWKAQYGRGISRVPRKTMWRRGTQFFWIGANTPGTRGGRKAHPPLGFNLIKKINKKEEKIAINSALAATAQADYFLKRYATASPIQLPLIVESLPHKTSSLLSTLKNILGKNFHLAFKKKVIRAGKGKMRNRKYKSNAGILILTSSQEKSAFKGIDVKPVSKVSVKDVYPLGRLTIYTEKAIKELEGKK